MEAGVDLPADGAGSLMTGVRFWVRRMTRWNINGSKPPDIWQEVAMQCLLGNLNGRIAGQKEHPL